MCVRVCRALHPHVGDDLLLTAYPGEHVWLDSLSFLLGIYGVCAEACSSIDQVTHPSLPTQMRACGALQKRRFSLALIVLERKD